MYLWCSLKSTVHKCFCVSQYRFIKNIFSRGNLRYSSGYGFCLFLHKCWWVVGFVVNIHWCVIWSSVRFQDACVKDKCHMWEVNYVQLSLDCYIWSKIFKYFSYVFSFLLNLTSSKFTAKQESFYTNYISLRNCLSLTRFVTISDYIRKIN